MVCGVKKSNSKKDCSLKADSLTVFYTISHIKKKLGSYHIYFFGKRIHNPSDIIYDELNSY